MGNIVKNIAYDIQTDLKQTFDDRKIDLAQVIYWVLMVGNKLKAQHIVKRSSGAFLSTFTDIPVQQLSSNLNPNDVKDRKFIILPKTIYDFNNDRAIDYIAYTSNGNGVCPPRFTRVTFTRTTPKTAERLYYSDYEKPRPASPYFYRIGDHVYFLGIEQADVKLLEIGLFTAFEPITTVNPDAVFDFPEELINQLKREVLDLARFSLQIPSERVNEGDAAIGTQQVPTQKLVSVQQQPEQQ